MSLDGQTDEIMFSSVNFIEFGIYDNEIYFAEDVLYKMGLDGSKVQQISSSVRHLEGITKDDIYTYDSGYGGRLYKTSMDGGESELILERSSHFWSFWVPLFILFCLSLRYCFRSGRSS